MSGTEWGLEVVRGRETGRLYRIESASTVIGNALAGTPGIDLSGQEPDSPRRMAAKQAVIEAEARLETIILRDLDSPGGTFVNRQRLLPGEGRSLVPGDLIQIGAVQLKVVRNGVVSATAPAASPSQNAINYRLADGTNCRGWDDFLKVASQKWEILRTELTSGRIDAWLRSIGRTDLLSTTGPDDDRLDQWLAKLPLTTAARPELDVHPKTMTVRVIPGGGITTRTVSVTNVGHRLLKITARVEPANTSWLKLGAAMQQQPRTVVDSFDLPLEIVIPGTLPHSLRATLAIDGNGGNHRLDVSLEAKSTADAAVAASAEPAEAGGDLRGWLAGIPLPLRVATLVLCAIAARVIVFVASRFVLPGVASPGGESPALLGPALVFFALGTVAGGVFTGRRGGKSQLVYGAVSGGITGAAGAAVLVAGCRGIEPLLGPLGQSALGAALIWAGLGVGLAVLSMRLIPFTAQVEETR